MSQSLTQIYLHIVFSTKHRHPYLSDKPFRERTKSGLSLLARKRPSSARSSKERPLLD